MTTPSTKFRPVRAALALLPALALLLAVALLPTACSDQETSQDQTTEPSAAATPTPITRSPQAIGQDIQAAHLQAMNNLAQILQSEQPPTDLLNQILALRETTIHQLVALGRERQKLDTFGKADCDRIIQQGMTQIPSYQTLDQARATYAANPELADALDSFNDIIHYAILELLKEQYPAEAARLGVD